MDLRLACYGPEPVGCRRLLTWLRQLPPGSPLHRSADPEGASWSTTDELIALVAELVDLSNRLFVQANSKKGAPAPKPIEIRRPWHTERAKQKHPRRAATAEEIRAFFVR